MLTSFDRSEAFRAQIFLTAGFLVMSPLGITFLNYLTGESELDLVKISISAFLFLSGLILVTKSYNIMEKRDKNYVTK
jgi:small neutral amino acid transporter SnatA (MarC family)